MGIITGGQVIEGAQFRAAGYHWIDLTGLRAIASNDIDTDANNGGVLASDTTPALERVNGSTDKALRVNWVSGNTNEAQAAPVPMPADLDENSDVTVHLLAKMSGTTDTPAIDVQAFDGIGDTEMGAKTSALSDSLQELMVTLSSGDISGHATGFLNIALVPEAHSTDAIELYAMWIEFTRKNF